MTSGFEDRARLGDKQAATEHRTWVDELNNPPRINLSDGTGFRRLLTEWMADKYGKSIEAYESRRTAVADDEGIAVPDGWDNASLLEEMKRSMLG